jgi:hypothetical protein
VVKEKGVDQWEAMPTMMRLPHLWSALDKDDATTLERELHRELPAGHILSGRELVAIAQRTGRDDVLFRESKQGAKFFLVHLTWSVETNTRWPATTEYSSLDDFSERWPREEFADE